MASDDRPAPPDPDRGPDLKYVTVLSPFDIWSSEPRAVPDSGPGSPAHAEGPDPEPEARRAAGKPIPPWRKKTVSAAVLSAVSARADERGTDPSDSDPDLER